MRGDEEDPEKEGKLTVNRDAGWCQMTRFENRVQFQGSRREKILEGTKLGQMECTEVLRPRDGLPEHFGI